MILFMFNYTIVIKKNAEKKIQKNRHLTLPQQLFKTIIDMPCSMFSIFKTLDKIKNTLNTFV